MTQRATAQAIWNTRYERELPHIRSLHFDRHERPARAVVVTRYGVVKVEWRDVAGCQCWFSSGTGDAKREAVPAIEHIERMRESML